MESNNMIGLLFIIIILLIVYDYCINKKINNVDTFTSGNTDETKYEEQIMNNIVQVKKKRNELKEVVKGTENKYKYDIEYYKIINSSLNDNLQDSKDKMLLNLTNDEEQIRRIMDKIKYLKKYNINTKPIKKQNSIQSLQNGTKLAIETQNGTDYSIILNNRKDSEKKKCLYVNANGNYNIEECDVNSEKQKFNLLNISTENLYKNNLEKGILSNKKLPYNVSYPFNLIKSKKNKNCVGMFNNELTISPCETKKSHRWKSSQENIVCPIK